MSINQDRIISHNERLNQISLKIDDFPLYDKNINIINGKKIQAICFNDIEKNSFIDKIAIGSDKDIIGAIDSKYYVRRLKKIKENYYILIQQDYRSSNNFYAKVIYISASEDNVIQGPDLYVWSLVDGLGNVEICINDENSFVLACDGWGNCTTKFFTVNYEDMTITQQSILYYTSTYAYQPGIIKLSEGKFLRVIEQNYNIQLEVINLTNNTLSSLSKTPWPYNVYDYDGGQPILIRENEAILQVTTDTGAGDGGSGLFAPVKYDGSNLIFGTLVSVDPNIMYGTGGSYPYSYNSFVNPSEFDVLVTNVNHIHALDVKNNVITVLQSVATNNLENYNPHLWIEKEGLAYLNTQNTLYKIELSNTSPYIALTSSTQTTANTGAAIGYNKNNSFGIILRVGSNNNIERFVSYLGDLDVIVPATVENVIYGISLENGKMGEEISCTVLNL